ncbi:hypothetical protein JW859_14110, partial [bacterium]|nr:hypothetical protein [bacterium]
LRRTSPGQWQAEKCFEDTDPLYQDYLGDLPGKLLDSWLRWQDNGEPIMFFNARKGKMETTSRAFVSRRTGGNWELSELYIGTEPRLDASINSVQQVGPDHWRMTAADNVGTPSDIYLLDYDHGSISLSDPEVPLERTEEKLQTYLEYRIDDQGDNYFRMIDMGKDQYGVWWPLINLSPEVRLWQGNAAAGWEMVVHDYSHLWSTEDFEVKAMLITGSDERVFTVDHYVYTGETVVKTGLYFILDTGASSRLLQAFDEYEWGVSKVQSALGTYAVMSNYSYSLLENKMPGIRKMTRYVQLEPQRIIVEEVARVEDSAEFDSIGHTDWIMQDDGNAYCLLVGEGSIFNPPDQPDALIEGYALGIRVDPRLNN